jgi:hypothetical protein
VSLHNLLESHQISKSIESDVVFPGSIKLVFDHQEHTSHLVGLLHKLDLIYILLEVDLNLEFHDHSVDEFFMHLGHHQKRVLLQP